jgi:prepilin-type N-terminal cleavage/methylation domain-containing protein
VKTVKNYLLQLKKSTAAGRKGFTLVEILIVLVIMSVLAAAIVPNLSKFVKEGTVGAANQERATVKNAVTAYVSQNQGSYPCSSQPTAGNPQAIITTSGTGIAPFMSSATIVGTYNIDINGEITGSSYSSLVWDITNHCWKK